MKLRANSISWNPTEPVYFTVASEDYNLYTFDMRKRSVVSLIEDKITVGNIRDGKLQVSDIHEFYGPWIHWKTTCEVS